MYKVIIVDDEKPARELLKMSLEWEKSGFQIVAEARDGEEALEMYQKYSPDLVITDIQMPVMDGIELIRKIKEKKPSQKFVILSCHESFAYAKQAMKMGVEDYLIKDTFTEGELYGILKNLVHDDERGRSSKEESHIRTLKIQRDEEYFGQIIRGEKDAADGLSGYFSEKQSSCFLACLSVDDFRYNKKAIEDDICELIYSTLDLAGRGIACYDGNGKFLIFSCFRSSHSLLETMNIRYHILQNVKSSVEKYVGSKLTIGVSQTFYSKDLILDKVKEARSALDFSVFLGKGKILYFEAVRHNEQSVKIDLLNHRFEDIRKNFEEKNYKKAIENIDGIYNRDLPGMMQCHYLHHINTLLLGLLTLLCSEHQIPYAKVFGKETISLQDIEQLDTVAEIRGWFTGRFESIIYLMEHRVTYSSRVKSVMEYIENNYALDIGIDDIAGAFNLHKVYLSRIFKEETGKSLNVCLNEVRIDKAKELLKQPGIKISDVVYRTGFNNPQSFYYIFKQVTGKTPKEYKV